MIATGEEERRGRKKSAAIAGKSYSTRQFLAEQSLQAHLSQRWSVGHASPLAAVANVDRRLAIDTYIRWIESGRIDKKLYKVRVILRGDCGRKK